MSEVESGREGERELFGMERVNALSDGVFAIILTLLVLELKLPERGADESVLRILAANGHVFVAWLISFAAIARFWVVHHAITAQLRACHTGTVALNFLVLGTASLMPFAADTIGNEQLAEPWSTVVFAGNIALVSLALGLLARHVRREEGLRRPGARTAGLERGQRHHLVVLPLVALAAAVLAFTHPVAAVALLAVEFVLVSWVVLAGARGRHERRVRRQHAGTGPADIREHGEKTSTQPRSMG